MVNSLPLLCETKAPATASRSSSNGRPLFVAQQHSIWEIRCAFRCSSGGGGVNVCQMNLDKFSFLLNREVDGTRRMLLWRLISKETTTAEASQGIIMMAFKMD